MKQTNFATTGSRRANLAEKLRHDDYVVQHIYMPFQGYLSIEMQKLSASNWLLTPVSYW